MKRAIDRTIQILVWGIGLTVVWALVAVTAWAAERSLLSAGPGYSNLFEPIVFIAGVLLVAVPGTLLVQHGHSAWQRHRSAAPAPDATAQASNAQSAPTLGREPVAIPIGRTVADLPAEPPIAAATGS